MIYHIAIFCCLIIFNSYSVLSQEDNLVPSTLLENVIKGDIDGIKAAITDAGESIDLVNQNGWSAARFAVSAGNMDVLRTLIQLNIDLNNPDSNGFTPLMAAAENVSKKI